MIVLVLIAIAACLDWFYLVARISDLSSQPNGGLAAAMLSTQADSVAIVFVVAVAGLAIGVRLDKLLKASEAVRAAMGNLGATASTILANAEPRLRIESPPSSANTADNRPGAVIVDMGSLPVRLVVRAIDGKLDELDALLTSVQGVWRDDAFEAVALAYCEVRDLKPRLVRISDVRRIGNDKASLTTDVQRFLTALARATRDRLAEGQ